MIFPVPRKGGTGCTGWFWLSIKMGECRDIPKFLDNATLAWPEEGLPAGGRVLKTLEIKKESACLPEEGLNKL